MSLPGKGLEGHICPTSVMSLGRHLEHHAFGDATKMIILWSGGHELLNYGE